MPSAALARLLFPPPRSPAIRRRRQWRRYFQCGNTGSSNGSTSCSQLCQLRRRHLEQRQPHSYRRGDRRQFRRHRPAAASMPRVARWRSRGGMITGNHAGSGGGGGIFINQGRLDDRKQHHREQRRRGCRRWYRQSPGQAFTEHDDRLSEHRRPAPAAAFLTVAT